MPIKHARLIMPLLVISNTIYGMHKPQLQADSEVAVVVTESCAPELPKEKSTIEAWPSSFYEEVWPGIRAIRSAQSIADLKQQATNVYKNPVAAANLNLQDKAFYSWVMALNFAEKKLFSKPYETWTVLDLQLLAGYLTQFTTTKPGRFREKEHRTGAKPTDKKEAKKFMRLLQAPESSLSKKDKQFLAQRLQSYPPPSELPALLETSLKQTQSELIEARTAQDPPTQKAALIAVAVKVHFEIVRISPFQDESIDDAHLRLGRLVMTIILHQHGIERPIYTDRAFYNGLMLKCLKAGKEAELLTYTYELIQRRERNKEFADTLESNPEIDGWIKTFTKAGDGKHPVVLDGKDAEQLLGLLKKEAHICTGCDAKQENGAFKCCSRCKKSFYCSPECQQKHWPEHKKECCAEKK